MKVTRDEFFKYTDLAVSLQNHPKNVTRDHMTIMGFMETHEELRDHVLKLAANINEEEVIKVSEKLSHIQGV